MVSGFQSYSVEVDSGLQSLVGFRIPSDGFQIPKLIIPDSASKIFWGFRILRAKIFRIPESEFPFMGRVLSSAHEKFRASAGPKSFENNKLFKYKTTIPYSRGPHAEGGVGVHVKI